MPAPPWVAGVLIHVVFPTVGGLLGLGLSATPLPTVYALERRNKGLGTFNPLPACVFLGNAGLWLGYGLSVADPFVYLANAPAALVSLHIILHTYPLASPAARRQMERVLALGLLALLGIGGLYLFNPPSASATSQPSSSSSHPTHPTLPTQVNGALASLVNVLLYASPLSSLAHVLRTRDASSILLPWTFTALGCSVTWAVYGAATSQIPVVIPHAFGFLLNIVHLILRVAVFPPQRPEGKEGGKGEKKMKISSGSSSSSSSSSSGGSIAMTIVKPGGRKGEKKQQQGQQAMKKKVAKKGGKARGRKAPVALLAGVRRRSDEENNYHRAPRRRIEVEEEEEDEDENLEQGGSEGEEAEEWDEEAGYKGKEAAVAATAVADFESSNTQAGRDRAGRGGRRDGNSSSSSSSRVDVTLFSSNDSAGAPQTMVVVVEGEEGLGREVATTTRGGGASSFPSSASSSSPFSVHAALSQEVGMGGWRKGGRAGLGGGGGIGEGGGVQGHLRRVSSSTPLCLYDSGSEEEEEEEKVEERRRGGQQRRREGGEGKRGEGEEEGDVSISF